MSNVGNIISLLSFRFQQKAEEESRDLFRLAKEQESINGKKKELNNVIDLIDDVINSGTVSENDLAVWREKFLLHGVSTTDLDAMQQVIDSIKAKNGSATNYAHVKASGDDNQTWARERRDILDAARKRVEEAREDYKDSDEEVSFKIQYHWGNYSSYMQTASSLEKRKDEHIKGVIQNF